MSTHTPPVSTKPVRVEIDESKFWTLAREHPVHMNVSVLKALRDAGVPVEGGIELRGVKHGRLTMFNESRQGKRFNVYEWAPGNDSQAPKWEDEDDEL